MDLQFLAQYPRERIIIDEINEISRTTFEENLNRLELILGDLHSDSVITSSHNELKACIRNTLDSEPDLAALIIDWNKEVEREQEKANSKKENSKKTVRNKITKLAFALSIKYATLYIELASKAYRESKLNQAWAYACKASYCCGEIVANSMIDLDILTIEKTSKTNSTNGKAITKKYKPLQEFIATLIREHKPENGWPSSTAAIRTVTSLKSPANENDKNKQPPTLVEVFIQEHRVPRVTEKSIYDRLLKTWRYECDSIKNALKETVLKPSKG